jgi:ferredoxin
MAYVVTENCIKCKYLDYVEVCPVDCFYEGENMVAINPLDCIDCGVCEPECPANAIKADSEPGLERWLELNGRYSALWPNVTKKRDVHMDTETFDGMAGKYARFFSPKPGKGD